VLDKTKVVAKGQLEHTMAEKSVLERMVGNLQAIPSGLQQGGAAADLALQAIREARAPWEKPPGPPAPRYAGLDVEAKALAALGSVDLGALFWGAQAVKGGDGTGGAVMESTLLDARCKEDAPWKLPERLHVTARFFGQRPDKAVLAEAEALVNSWFSVEVRALVYVRGGGLLCAECAVLGDGAEALERLAGDDWWPHITLQTAKPWWPKDSTAVLKACAEALEQGAGASPDADEVIDLLDEEAAQEGDEDAALRASLSSALGSRPASPQTDSDGQVQLLRGLSVCGRPADICVLPLQPARQLGPCKFKMFFA